MSLTRVKHYMPAVFSTQANSEINFHAKMSSVGPAQRALTGPSVDTGRECQLGRNRIGHTVIQPKCSYHCIVIYLQHKHCGCIAAKRSILSPPDERKGLVRLRTRVQTLPSVGLQLQFQDRNPRSGHIHVH